MPTNRNNYGKEVFCFTNRKGEKKKKISFIVGIGQQTWNKSKIKCEQKKKN